MRDDHLIHLLAYPDADLTALMTVVVAIWRSA